MKLFKRNDAPSQSDRLETPDLALTQAHNAARLAKRKALKDLAVYLLLVLALVGVAYCGHLFLKLGRVALSLVLFITSIVGLWLANTSQ